VVDIAIRTQGLTTPVDVTLGTNFGIVEWGEGFIGLMGSASLVDDKVLKETPDGEAERKGDVKWSAIQDKYFLSVLMPQKASAALAKKEGDKLVSAGVRFPAPAAGSTMAMQLYAGPKEYDTLKGLNAGLEDTIDFGWFVFGSWGLVKAVAKPIFYVLRFLHEFTHNYGVTIILLTMLIKLMFVPLQYKSYKSMKQMQVIQPKVLAIQNKFKDDRERLNKELIKLYKDHRVNPVGGCLPMVLQMPVFVALFNILYMTIDLRQAPFMLWIKDLSVQDPYYVLPIIMGATMVIQQKITPTTMDPMQAKIMLFLPVFMTFLFVNFPAGLVLYWLTNNTLTITQQVVTERLFGKKWQAPPEGVEAAAIEELKEQKSNGKRRNTSSAE
jgi:YidC/Oxa1 family membrane protein insertase